MNHVDTHLNRLRTAVLKRYTAGSIARWITEHTKYANELYSYRDHEYQERILSDTSKDVAIRKCSQVGISEASSRMGLALVNVLSPYTVAYTLPTAHFAGTFTKTRIDPVIETSPTLKSAIHKTNDNNEVKQFGNSFLWVRGAASSNAPISIPCDHLIHDEVDFSDQEVLSQYVSRLTHSKWKRTHKISTPTLPNFGIDKAFQESRRHFMFVKCNHCNFDFIPDYYKHVRVPMFPLDLRRITKGNLGKTRYKEAYVECPHCGGKPDLGIQYRRWVCENPESGFETAGYQVSPFDAPNIITPGYLVEASTKYDRIQDFENFNLGLPSDDKEATLSRDDLLGCFHAGESASSVRVMGVDVGSTYHFAIGTINPMGGIHTDHLEKVPMGRAKERYFELRRMFNVSCTVIDSGPHAETVMSIQEQDPTCYASVYMRSRSILTHTVVDKDEEKDRAKEFQRQVNVNRNRALDAYMNFIRDGNLSVQPTEHQEEFIQHHCSMKRVKIYDNDSGEMQYSWQKSDGIDHFHHTSLYMWVASKIRGVAKPIVALPYGQMFTMRLKEGKT